MCVSKNECSKCTGECTKCQKNNHCKECQCGFEKISTNSYVYEGEGLSYLGIKKGDSLDKILITIDTFIESLNTKVDTEINPAP